MNAAQFLAFPAAKQWNPTSTNDQVKWLKKTVAAVQPVAGLLARAYVDTARNADYVQANHQLREASTQLQRYDLNLSWTDEDLCAWCERRAEKCVILYRQGQETDSEETLLGLIKQAQGIVDQYGIELPDPKKHAPLPVLARLADAQWWRKKARILQAKEIERLAILLGRVRKGREIYCSDETVKRRSAQKNRNRKYLEATTATNQDGQTYTLAELADLSISNPKIRRVELMVRIRGFDEVAQLLGHVREFWTFTTPSRFHRWTTVGLAKFPKANKKWDGSSPSEAQGWLSGCWARIRAALARFGIRLYGFRVVEAHHDGTPHWHAAIFYAPVWMCRAEFSYWPRIPAGSDSNEALEGVEFYPCELGRASAPRVRAIVRSYLIAEERQQNRNAIKSERRHERQFANRYQYALNAFKKVTPRAIKATAAAMARLEDMKQSLADLRAAQKHTATTRQPLRDAIKHRCDFEEIDPKKGDAAGYLAKYITKAIASDEAGELVQQDMYGYDAGVSARRVDAWASSNRVRQFQQIGGASVTTWREMRRAMAGEVTQCDLFDAPRTVQLAAEAADESNWQAYILMMGGPMVARDKQLVRLAYWHEHTADGEVVGMPFNRYGEAADKKIFGLSYDNGKKNILTRVHTWKVERTHEERTVITTAEHLLSETNRVLREVDAATEWKPWAFDILGTNRFGTGFDFDFRFSGAPPGAPLESCQ